MDWLDLAPLGILLLMMIAVSAFGWNAIPAGTRIPVRFGISGLQGTLSKATALVMWPALGAVVAGGVYIGGQAGDTVALMLLGLAAEAILLIAQYSAVRKAARD